MKKTLMLTMLKFGNCIPTVFSFRHLMKKKIESTYGILLTFSKGVMGTFKGSERLHFMLLWTAGRVQF